MADYICKHCKFNNNGWCVALKKNKLSTTIECDSFKSGKYGNFEVSKDVQEIKPMQKEGRKWHKVQFEECFYDDMVGWFVESTDKTITLKFGEKIGQATFYKHQLEFHGEF